MKSLRTILPGALALTLLTLIPLSANQPEPVTAQTPCAGLRIHDHPQKACYNSPSEWPFISWQSHLDPANSETTHHRGDTIADGVHNPQLGHTHVECRVPLLAETTLARIPMNCQVVLFNVLGHVSTVWGEFIHEIVWKLPDGRRVPQTSMYRAPIPLVGNPRGVVVYPFDITIDPAIGAASNILSPWHRVPQHGYWGVSMYATTRFENGAMHNTSVGFPLYSVINPIAPIDGESWAAPVPIMNRGDVGFPGFPDGETFGAVIVAMDPHAPILAPINTRQSVPMGGTSYGASDALAGGLFEAVAKLDLHNGNPGVSLSRVFGSPGAGEMVTIDPADFGPGPTKVAAVWAQTSKNLPSAPQILASTLIAVTVTVGDDVPPAPVREVCGDGVDNDGDGLVDEGCAPPPPPPPTAVTFTPVHIRTGDVAKVCDAADLTKCWPLPAALPAP